MTKYCHECGAELLTDTSKFCTICGAKNVDDRNSQQSKMISNNPQIYAVDNEDKKVQNPRRIITGSDLIRFIWDIGVIVVGLIVLYLIFTWFWQEGMYFGIIIVILGGILYGFYKLKK